MSTKQQRQQIITRLIAQENVCSQPHLQEMLKDQGIEAGQGLSFHGGLAMAKPCETPTGGHRGLIGTMLTKLRALCV